MRIGRFEFGVAYGKSTWDYTFSSCECRILGLGRFYVTWLSPVCKFGLEQYENSINIFEKSRKNEKI